MRTDTPVPMGEESLLLAKWVPEAPKPPPGVLVFIGDDEPGEYDDTAQALAEKGFVVAHVRPYRIDDADSMKTQYDFLKNQYKAIPFFAAAVGDQIPMAAMYAKRYPKDFYGMVWIDPTFESREGSLPDEERTVGLFERIFTAFDESDIDAEHVKDSVRSLPRMPLAVFTDELQRSAKLLSDISHDREITLLVFPKKDDPAYRMKALVRQLKAWHIDRVDELVKTKRGALRWDRERRERE